MSNKTYGPVFRWFAWHPTNTQDRGWRWLRMVYRVRQSTYNGKALDRPMDLPEYTRSFVTSVAPMYGNKNRILVVPENQEHILVGPHGEIRG